MDPATAHAPPTESARLKAVQAYGILDTPPEPEFDHIVSAAARVFGVSAAALTIVARDRCWFKAQIGLGVSELPRNYGLCGYAYGSSGVFVVEDATLDERFKQLPLVTEAGFRFYIGVPLVTPEGHALGLLCVLDRRPRTALPAQVSAVQTLAAQALAHLEARRPGAAAAAPRTADASRPRRRSILVADDEPAILRFMGQLLKFQGFTAYCAADGVEALELYREHTDKIGLVVTDLNMPRLGGIDLIRTLRGEARPPVLAAMTGRLEPATARLLAAEGVTHILAKPFAIEDLAPVLALLPENSPAANGL